MGARETQRRGCRPGRGLRPGEISAAGGYRDGNMYDFASIIPPRVVTTIYRRVTFIGIEGDTV